MTNCTARRAPFGQAGIGSDSSRTPPCRAGTARAAPAAAVAHAGSSATARTGEPVPPTHLSGIAARTGTRPCRASCSRFDEALVVAPSRGRGRRGGSGTPSCRPCRSKGPSTPCTREPVSASQYRGLVREARVHRHDLAARASGASWKPLHMQHDVLADLDAGLLLGRARAPSTSIVAEIRDVAQVEADGLAA